MRPEKPYDPLIDVGRAAEIMGISPQNVRELVRSGKLNAVIFSGESGRPTYRFRASAVERAIQRRARGFRNYPARPAWESTLAQETVPTRRPPIILDLARIQEMRNAGRSFVEIGHQFGVSSTTIANALRTGQTQVLPGPGRPRIRVDDQTLEKAIARRREGAGFMDIATELGVSSGIIRNAVRDAAPELLNPPGFRDHGAVTRMVDMRRSGATFNEIGAEFGLHGSSVSSGFKAMGIHTPPVKRGGHKANVDVARAMEMRRSGMTYVQIAKEFGVCIPTITHRIRQGYGLKGSLFNFDIKKAMKMRREGHTFVEISKAVGASRPTVTNAIKLRQLHTRPARLHPNFDLALATQMRSEGKSYQAIAKALGVTSYYILKFLKPAQ